MISWTALLLPALISAVLVFFVSSVIHMMLKWHNPDYRKLPNEDDVRAVIRKGAPTPGQYIVPHCTHGKDAQNPETMRKFEEGPIACIYIKPNGMIKLGPFLGKWVVYTLVVGLLAGYVARFTLLPGAPFLNVFRVVGTAAWLAYAWQSPADSIWKGKPWIVAFRDMVDGLVYALITAAVFGWLWPR